MTGSGRGSSAGERAGAAAGGGGGSGGGAVAFFTAGFSSDSKSGRSKRGIASPECVVPLPGGAAARRSARGWSGPRAATRGRGTFGTATSAPQSGQRITDPALRRAIPSSREQDVQRNRIGISPSPTLPAHDRSGSRGTPPARPATGVFSPDPPPDSTPGLT